MVETLSLAIDPSKGRSGARVFKSELGDIKRGATDTEGALDRMGRNSGTAMNKASVSAKAFGASMNVARISAIALGAAVGAAAIKGFQSARGLDAALAEASTLLEGTTAEMSLMRREATAMAAEFGGSTTQQVEAFYQAISAGAGSVEEATILLNSANQLAKGGVTDITTSVDVLTSATNAYAAAGLEASTASDILFTGVKFGKTTVDELASTLGNVIPIASSVGVGFDEIVAATAALTTQGQSTSIAITGIRGALSAVLKPTSEAAEIAEDLGIQFNTAGLKAKGFGGFIEDIIDKTDGSQEAIAKLFGSVEALNAVLAFTGGAGAAFNATMQGMADSAGATQEAADKVSSSLSDRLDVALGKIGVAAEWLGGILLNIVVPAMEGVVFAVEGVIAGVRALGQDVAAVFQFFTKEVVNTAKVTDTWTSAVDTHIQAEFDLEFALNRVDGSNISAANTAVKAAAANLEAAQAAYDRVDAEVAVAKAIAATQAVEASAARSAAEGGANIFFGAQAIAQTEADFESAISFVDTLEIELKARREGLSRATQAVLTANTMLRDPEIWEPVRNKVVDDTTDSVLDLDDAVTKLGSNPAIDNLGKGMKELMFVSEDVADSIANNIGQGFSDMVTGTKTVAAAFKSMARNIITELFEILVVQQLVAGIKGLLGFSDGGAFSGGQVLANANGNAFSGGNVVPFASGGVVNSPTLFPMANGIGLMGEAGPEAIMPLSRGRDGKLGVKSEGGGSQTVVNQTINVTAGVAQTVRAEMIGLLPQLKEQTIQAVTDANRRSARA